MIMLEMQAHKVYFNQIFNLKFTEINLYFASSQRVIHRDKQSRENTSFPAM